MLGRGDFHLGILGSYAMALLRAGSAAACQAVLHLTPGVNVAALDESARLPNAQLPEHIVLPAGGTAAGTAALKLTTQAAGLTAVEQGAVELIGNSLQFTQLAKRRGVAMSQGVLLADVTVTNTVTESAAIFTAAHGAGYLEVGKCEEIVLRGTIRQQGGGSQLQVRVKYAGVTLVTPTTNTGAISAGSPFEIRVTTTVRSVGPSGTLQVNVVFWIENVNNTPDSVALTTIDTTTAQDTTITVQWTQLHANNIFTVNQGRVLCIEPNR